jgi:glycopeptide antibiotics resistance protein
LFRALSQRISDPSIYLAAVTIGFVFGILDELIQWVVPRRYFDLRDIGINLLSVMLIQLGIAAGIRPAFIRGKMSSSGLTLALWGAIVTLALFALSFTIKTPTL